MLMQWMDSSSRFTAFVETYRDKIRKKIRVTRDPESALDVRGELEVAYGLLTDRRLAVAYEPYASAKRRGPDFAVTYRANLVFNIEVARIRVEERRGGEFDLQRKEERIVRILLDKLGQMQPGMANLLVIHTRESWREHRPGPANAGSKNPGGRERSLPLFRQRLCEPGGILQGFLHPQRNGTVGA